MIGSDFLGTNLNPLIPKRKIEVPVRKSWKNTNGLGMNPPIKGMNITIRPIGKGITIGSTLVHTIGIGILMKGNPSRGLSKGGGRGIKEGGRYPTGQYFIPQLGANKAGFSIGGTPFSIGSNPTLLAFFENSFQ